MEFFFRSFFFSVLMFVCSPLCCGLLVSRIVCACFMDICFCLCMETETERERKRTDERERDRGKYFIFITSNCAVIF